MRHVPGGFVLRDHPLTSIHWVGEHKGFSINEGGRWFDVTFRPGDIIYVALWLPWRRAFLRLYIAWWPHSLDWSARISP